MTVQELKALLEKYDDDMPVVVDRDEYGYRSLDTAEVVRFMRYPERDEVNALRLAAEAL